jgi:riboflavin kinase / FMN adenylyltransferase
MKLLRDLSNLPDTVRHGAVAIGNFDGVHHGHKQIVERLLAKARQCGGPAIVFTFDPHPVRLLRPEQAPPPLTWTDRKAELLAQLGVDTTIAYPTNEELLQLSPQQFFKHIVCNTLQARAMVEGTNFYFGHHRAGNIEVLQKLCSAAGIPLKVVEPVLVDGAPVSSSRIRQLISAGHIHAANQMLTQPYRIRGMVRHGAARGAKIGFPTANVDAVDTLLPGAGVYAGRCAVEGHTWAAAINIGPNPTFGENTFKVEVHLVGFHDSLYGQPLEVDFLARLRDIVQFPDVEALKKQLSLDVSTANEVFRRPVSCLLTTGN